INLKVQQSPRFKKGSINDNDRSNELNAGIPNELADHISFIEYTNSSEQQKKYLF
ncbi:MAG: hypothetical protein MHMPM18_004925, partial [Marteilia pararefringens]